MPMRFVILVGLWSIHFSFKNFSDASSVFFFDNHLILRIKEEKLS